MNLSRRIDFERYVKPAEEKVGGGLMTGALTEVMNNSFELKEVIKLIKPEANVLWVSDGKWSAHQLLMALLNITGTADVYISSYAMSETPARHLVKLRETGIIRSLFCVLDNRVDTRTAGTLQIVKSICNDYALVDTHAKVTLLQNSLWNIAVIGSANYTENNRYEAGIISCTEAAVYLQLKWIIKALKNGNK